MSFPKRYSTARVRTSVLRRGALLAAAVIAIACGGESATAPTSPVGAYQLSTIQGKPLPFRLYSDTNYSFDIAKGTLSLGSDGNFTAAFLSEERVEGHLSVYADTSTGAWALSGTSITFTASDNSKTKGIWSGRTISLVDSTGVTPVTYVYSAP